MLSNVDKYNQRKRTGEKVWFEIQLEENSIAESISYLEKKPGVIFTEEFLMCEKKKTSLSLLNGSLSQENSMDIPAQM